MPAVPVSGLAPYLPLPVVPVLLPVLPDGVHIPVGADPLRSPPPVGHPAADTNQDPDQNVLGSHAGCIAAQSPTVALRERWRAAHDQGSPTGIMT